MTSEALSDGAGTDYHLIPFQTASPVRGSIRLTIKERAIVGAEGGLTAAAGRKQSRESPGGGCLSHQPLSSLFDVVT